MANENATTSTTLAPIDDPFASGGGSSGGGGSTGSLSSLSSGSSSGGSSVWDSNIQVTSGLSVHGAHIQEDGEVVGTGTALLGELYNMSPGQLTDLQTQMWMNGFYPSSVQFDEINFGTADEVTAKAFTGLLNRAHQSRRSIQAILNGVPMTVDNLNGMLRRSGGKGGGGGAARTRVIQHTNPTDLHEAAIQGFQAALGYAPSKEQEAAFIAAFHGQEDAAQPNTAGGGTFNITDPANPTLAAKAMAEKDNPANAQSYSRLQKFGVILSALGVK